MCRLGLVNFVQNKQRFGLGNNNCDTSAYKDLYIIFKH